VIAGQDRAVEQFGEAWATRRLHHAWLLAGSKGVGKATFAKQAAKRVLADAAGPASGLPGLETDNQHPIVKLVNAGSHPDMRWLERLPRERGEGLARNISVDQVRELGDFMAMTAALSSWRIAVIDSVDDLETSGANALLKMLEEPPANTLFFLISHAPGRLLPTIRSRCRRLEFQPLEDDAMASILTKQAPSLSQAERDRVIAMSFGSAGRALAFAEFDLAKLESAAIAILRQGDPTNARRSDLASELGKKAAAERYAAFLDLAPSLIAREARQLGGLARERALDAYAKARELAAVAPRLSLDPAATVFQIGGILASVPDRESAPAPSLKR
jgi:DNA polymerase-3 subunit delta'